MNNLLISQVHAIREGFLLKPNILVKPNKNMELQYCTEDLHSAIHMEEKNDNV
jgi:hypothetical protein